MQTSVHRNGTKPPAYPFIISSCSKSAGQHSAVGVSVLTRPASCCRFFAASLRARRAPSVAVTAYLGGAAVTRNPKNRRRRKISQAPRPRRSGRRPSACWRRISAATAATVGLALRRARVAGEERRAAGVGERRALEDRGAALGVVAGAGGDDRRRACRPRARSSANSCGRRRRRRCPSPGGSPGPRPGRRRRCRRRRRGRRGSARPAPAAAPASGCGRRCGGSSRALSTKAISSSERISASSVAPTTTTGRPSSPSVW